MASNKEKGGLRIVFMGTPDFAVAGLSALTEAGYTIVGVITAPDRPAGRGRKLQESAIKRFALTKGLKVLQPTNLKDESFINELTALKPNLQIVVAFRMLPKAVWQLPELGTFNLHASLLPQYRGAAPINWAIINGEETTGVTTFFIDEKIDTGEIILQEETDIHYDDDAGALHDRLMTLGAAVILKTVELIEENRVVTQTQPQSETLKTAPKIYREDCKINWGMPGGSIYNFIRGLSPYPTAWCFMKNGQDELSIKIYKTVFETEKHQLNVGTLVSNKNSMKIAVIDGYIELLCIQLPGKRKMTVKEVLNGLKLEKDAHVL